MAREKHEKASMIQSDYIASALNSPNDDESFEAIDLPSAKLAHYYEKALQMHAQYSYNEALKLAFRCKELLPSDYWKVAKQDALQVSLLIAECSYLLGYRAQAFNFLEQVERYADSRLEKLKLYKLYAYIYMVEEDCTKLVSIVRKACHEGQILLPPKIAKHHVSILFWRLQWEMKDCSEQTFLQLPEMQLEEHKLLLQIFVYLLCSGDQLGQQELQYFSYRSMLFTLQIGVTAESSVVYMKYALVAGVVHNHVKQRELLKKMALKLAENEKPFVQMIVHFLVGQYVAYFEDNEDKGSRYIRKAQQYALLDPLALRFTSLTTAVLTMQWFASEPLKTLHETLNLEQFCYEKLQLPASAQFLHALRQSITAIRNPHEQTDEIEAFQTFNSFTTDRLYTVIALQMSYLKNDAQQMEQLLKRLEQQPLHDLQLFHQEQYLLYRSLLQFQLLHKNRKLKKQVAKQLEQAVLYFRRKAKTAPAKYEHYYTLLIAEQHYQKANYFEASYYYERAIQFARSRGRELEFAIVLKRAATYFEAQGDLLKTSNYYNEAVAALQKWGAETICQQWQATYRPYLSTSQNGDELKHSEQLKLMIDVTQSLAKEIRMEEMLQTLLQLMLKHKNATVGYFIRVQQQQPLVVAVMEATRNDFQYYEAGATVLVEQQSFIDFVIQCEEPLVIHHVQKSALLVNKGLKAKSILCLPVFYNGQIRAVLHLENHLFYDAFNKEQLQMLRMISTQIAISLENAEHYEELERRVQMRTKMYEQMNHDLSKVNVQLAEKEEKQKLLFQGVSHQLRSPITSALGYMEAILDDVVTDEHQQRQYVMRSKERLISLQQLVEEIVELVVLETGRVDYTYKIINVAQYFERLMQQLEQLAAVKHLQIVCNSFVDQTSLIKIDEQRITQVIGLLIRHMAQTAHNKSIYVTAKVEHRIFYMYVEHSDQQYTKRNYSTMFEAYFHAAQSEEVPMTGVELAICKKIVEQHQGEISAHYTEQDRLLYTIAVPIID